MRAAHQLPLFRSRGVAKGLSNGEQANMKTTQPAVRGLLLIPVAVASRSAQVSHRACLAAALTHCTKPSLRAINPNLHGSAAAGLGLGRMPAAHIRIVPRSTILQHAWCCSVPATVTTQTSNAEEKYNETHGCQQDTNKRTQFCAYCR